MACMLEEFAEREFRALLGFIAETPQIVRELARGLAPDELKRKPSASEFSFQENVCHLRDIEREGYTVRIEKLLREHEPVLPDIDGAQLARERDYNGQDFEAGLEEFASLREKNVAALKGLSPESLSRAGTFEGAGRVTLKRLARMMREHDEAHRAELKGLGEWLMRSKAAGL
ncbi:MAG TPA: DinB family protein [Pyrinomonadaceae bacterium]|nr:DinB family protein [Pyrinomonadaceae bacterium]